MATDEANAVDDECNDGRSASHPPPANGRPDRRDRRRAVRQRRPEHRHRRLDKRACGSSCRSIYAIGTELDP